MRITLLSVAIIMSAVAISAQQHTTKKQLVAHRGASAYAPEHTIDAYKLAMAQGADYVDLDGPLLLAEDRPHPLHYDAAGVHPPDANLWG